MVGGDEPRFHEVALLEVELDSRQRRGGEAGQKNECDGQE
jgi:hypothetical protein